MFLEGFFMKIAVIGANGMIGSRAIAEALARSVEVDAYSRKGNNVDGAFNIRSSCSN